MLTFCASFASSVGKYNNIKDPQNFQTSGHQTALASVHITKSGAASLPQKAQDVYDLRRHLFDV